jgi:choline-sulfatase
MKGIAKKIIFLSIFLSLLGCTTSHRSPNIILIVVDTLRKDYLGCYGFRGDISPSIDALAKESIVFDHCISQASWTKPSVATILTSLYPETHGVFPKKRDATLVREEMVQVAISTELKTLPEILQDNGYATQAFVANFFLTKSAGFEQGFDGYHNDQRSGGMPMKEIAESALAWIGNCGRAKPFFLYLQPMDCHGPYKGSEPDSRALADSESLGSDQFLSESELKRIDPSQTKGLIIRPKDSWSNVRNWRLAYASGVRRFDKSLGDFIEQLRLRGLLDDTIVIFTADHGEELHDHGGWEHGDTVFGEVTNVPLLIRLPGPPAQDRRLDTPVGLIDLMPTILKLAGLPGQKKAPQGTDFSTEIYGRDHLQKPLVFCRACSHRPITTNFVSVQDSRFKLVWDYPHGKKLLFDVENDPLERTDLSKNQPSEVDALSNQLVDHETSLEKEPHFSGITHPLDEETLEQIRSLGYLQ